MQKITTFLMFDKGSREATELYASLFDNSGIDSVKIIDSKDLDGSEEEINYITFHLAGQTFYAMDAGPYFKFSPSISFFIACDTVEELDRIWEKLSPGGKVFMDVGKYPWSERYGWVEDRFGISWQLILGAGKQKVSPSLLFADKNRGRGKEAIELYTKVFKNAELTTLVPYGPNDQGIEGTVMYSEFWLEGMMFHAMDSHLDHGFEFTWGTSFYIDCADQAEVDYFWDALIAGGGAPSQCGWVQDPFGVSWQIVPRYLSEQMASGEREKVKRMVDAMLKMGKLIVKDLEDAYEGR